jgi:hypothetical protein
MRYTDFKIRPIEDPLHSALVEYTDLNVAKKSILDTISNIDTNMTDEALRKQNEELLDKIYTILNKSNVIDRVSSIIPNLLKGEYPQKQVLEIAGLLADAPLNFKEKLAFAENLSTNKVIDEKVLLTPGTYTIDALCHNNAINKTVFDYMKSYGVGQQMKGPCEHALAILNSEISIKGKGDVTIGSVPVEIKAAIGPTGAGGRFGESGEVPNVDRILAVLDSFDWLKGPLDEQRAKSKNGALNLEALVNVVNSVPDLPPAERTKLGNSLFTLIFGAEGNLVAQVFNRPGATPADVYNAFVKSNFNWYKNSDMGGRWEVIAGINFKFNAIGVMANADDLDKINRGKSTIYIVYGKPMEMLYQFNPRA